MRPAVLAVAVSLVCYALPQDRSGEGPPAHSRKRVAEEMFVRIGGIDQWITIKGDDRNNPVVLFLHGGPGDAASSYADAWFGGWEKEFTFVQWDQRGAGRTYGKNGPLTKPAMTIDLMMQDGNEVAEFLGKHLHKKKIILVGGSWGSVLGIHMAHARPDLFFAFVGMAQVVNMRQALAAGYTRLLELARAAGDEDAITDLTTLGPLLWDGSDSPRLVAYGKWRRTFQAKRYTAPPAPDITSAAYSSPEEKAQYQAAEDFTGEQLWGWATPGYGPLINDDLAALGLKFAIPIFMIQGEEDLTALPELAKAYFDSIQAPRKQFYLVPGTGHDPSVAELDLTRKVLIEQVRPLALR
jgi:pimeloyl-ACP methyl ester carboxylesterase